MPALTCYRMRSRPTDAAILKNFAKLSMKTRSRNKGPVEGSNFSTKLYLRRALSAGRLSSQNPERSTTSRSQAVEEFRLYSSVRQHSRPFSQRVRTLPGVLLR
jgi:hypothetical protein